MRLSKTTFRYIEKEIYDYYDTKHKLTQLTYDIIQSTPEYQEIRSTEVSDPTFMKASMLALHKERTYMQDITEAIHATILLLDPEIFDTLNDKYWKRAYLTWQQVADLYNVDRRTLYRWRSAFITDIAKRMGMS